MQNAKFSERLISSTARKYLNNFLYQPIDSRLINAAQDGIIQKLKEMLNADFIVDVSQSKLVPDKINVYIRWRPSYSIKYNTLSMLFPENGNLDIEALIEEILNYDIEEVLNN